MPAIGQPDNAKRGAVAMEEIAEQLASLVACKEEQHAEITGWIFTINRDGDGFIKTVEAKPHSKN